MSSVPVDKAVLERNLSDLEDAWGLLESLHDLFIHRPIPCGPELATLEKERGAEYAELYKNAFVGKWYIQNQELIEPLLNICRKVCQRSAEDIGETLLDFAEQKEAKKQTAPQKQQK